jgi:hypothetical protein
MSEKLRSKDDSPRAGANWAGAASSNAHRRTILRCESAPVIELSTRREQLRSNLSPSFMPPKFAKLVGGDVGKGQNKA